MLERPEGGARYAPPSGRVGYREYIRRFAGAGTGRGRARTPASFVAKGLDGIDPGGDAGGEITRHERHHGQQDRDSEVRGRIGRGHLVQQTVEQTRETERCEETDSEAYGWLNRIVAVGVGRREPDAAVYEVYEIL